MTTNDSEEDDNIPIELKILLLVSIIVLPFAFGGLFLIDITENTQEIEIAENTTSDEIKLQLSNIEESANYVIVRSSNTNQTIYQDTTVELDRNDTEYVAVVAVKEDVTHPYLPSEEIKEEVFYNSY